MSTTVAQVFGVTVTATGSNPTMVGGVAATCFGFRVTNVGNGPTTYTLAASVGQGAVAPAFVSIYLDTDGDGVCSPSHDPIYSPGGNDPTLDPGHSILVWVVVGGPASAPSGPFGPVSLTARGRAVASATTVTPVVTAASVAPVAPQVQVAVEPPKPVETATLVKSQTVRDAGGGTRPLPGAIITYTLKAQFSGNGTANSVSLSDPIPSGATYVPGTLRLDGAVLTDAADGDPGRIDASGVTVVLGDVSGETDHTVSFQVRINQSGASS